MTPEWNEAVRRGSVEELRHLVAAGLDVDARDEHGQTALMLAAADGSRLVVQWLVDCGAGLDHTGKYNLSALMLAVVNGRVDVVRTLVSAGANLGLRGTGAPGFAGKTALDLAVARNEAEIIDILRSGRGDESRMTSNLHFATAGSWAAAEAMLTFRPLQPSLTAGFDLQALRIHIHDHRMRELPAGNRTLEAHYGGFVASQSRMGAAEARRLALIVSYGPAAQEARIAGREARVSELGPEPPFDDIDGRNPAVVTWPDADMFYLIASGEISADTLIRIAASMYERVT